MLFNSFAFLVFAIIVIPTFFLLPHKHRWKLLLAASCFFYMYLIPIYILVLFSVITIDYFAALQIHKTQGIYRKRWLWVSLCGNLGILLFFKYFNFFLDNINQLTALFPLIKTRLPHLNIILPIGLSFHTFQAISYTIEVYKGRQLPEKHYGIYALYVMFFPQLVAGPIERPQNLLHQFHEKKVFSMDALFSGLRMLLWGLFLKTVIADRLAIPVDTVFNIKPMEWKGFSVLLAAIFFNVQVYCDFAGYSYMAVGIARVLGFSIMQNFNFPLFSRNIAEFWRKWHISLSTWFRDYVFIPLGGNKEGELKLLRNILIVFTICGIWHGASNNFLLWGLFHAMLMIIYYKIKQATPNHKLPAALAIFITFFLCCYTRVFYRAADFAIAKNMYINTLDFRSNDYWKLYIANDVHAMYGTFMGLDFSKFVYTLLLIPILFVLEYFFIMRKDTTIETYPKAIKWSIYYATIISILVLGVFETRQFVYFQF